MRRRTAIATSLVALGALPSLAGAQGTAAPPAPAPAPAPAPPPVPAPVPPPVPPPAPEPTPPPALAGKVTLKLKGGVRTRRARYVMRGQRLVAVARVRPFVPGQVAALEVIRRGRVVARKRAAIRRSRRGGRAVFRLEARRPAFLRVRHRATPGQRAFRSRAKRIVARRFQAGAGARGPRVMLLQRALRRLGFAVPVTGHYDAGTARAVTAFRKVNGLGRDGYATQAVYARAFRRRGAFKPRFPRAGRHVEFDWSRQVLALIDKGRAHRVYHASSGKASTPTVFGAFTFYRKQPGTNSHGMVQSNYFIGGYAVHGYASVPNFPASHGCIRVPIPNASQIDRQIEIGQKIFVYR